LARVVRSNLQAGLSDVALWHERDISHSSVERVVLPATTMLAHYLMRRLRRLIDNLEVDTERMLTNLWSSYGLVFSQPVLLALVAAGMTRDDAYRVVQRNAMATWDQQRPFRELLDADPEVTAVLSSADLDAAFDLDRALVNVERTLAALAPLR